MRQSPLAKAISPPRGSRRFVRLFGDRL